MGYLEYVPSFVASDNVDGVGILDISVSLFDTFFLYEFDVSLASDICANTMKMGINPSVTHAFDDISLSYCKIKDGAISDRYIDQTIHKDILRRASHEITGAYSALDIFTNETEMKHMIADADISFSIGFNAILHDASNVGLLTRAEYQALSNENIEIKGLLHTSDLLICFILDSESDNSVAYDMLQNKMTEAYMSNGNNFPIRISLGFSVGQYVALQIQYNPVAHSYFNTQLGSTSYKCLLKMC
jgi:hypothetical protein